MANSGSEERLVPDSVIPHHLLPPLKYRDLPEPISIWKMIGPSVILAGLALGSGEFVLWPYITYKAGFVFFWACLLGVFTQFFLNMEIERWTLATGESAITGFCRLSRVWIWAFLVFNIVPWIWPGWGTGAATMLSWLAGQAAVERHVELEQPLVEPIPAAYAQQIRLVERKNEPPRLVLSGTLSADQQAQLLAQVVDPIDHAAYGRLFAATLGPGVTQSVHTKYVNILGVIGLIALGVVLTAGPVVYNTVEKIQLWLVGLIFVLSIGLALLVVRGSAITAMITSLNHFGAMPPAESLSLMALLGALAFAGAGGSLNLGQSNFIKDKGYGMGKYLGRITSPLTGEAEATHEIGYHFEHTPENMQRWKAWWRAANWEHALSFLLTCIVCLVVLQLVAFSLFYDDAGKLRPGMEHFGKDTDFIWAQAGELERQLGPLARIAFLVMGMAILLTTELGVLDATARISTDIVKVNFLRENSAWSQSRLYYTFLWSTIAIGCGILIASDWIPEFGQPRFLLILSAGLNGGVMFVYSLLLLYMNTKILSRSLAPSPTRFLAMVWASAFYGYFTWLTLTLEIGPMIASWWRG